MSTVSIVNLHQCNTHNVGDIQSAPVRYFEFPGFHVITHDILVDLEGKWNNHIIRAIILGGGGLLNPYFRKGFRALSTIDRQCVRIAWGVGQHEDGHGWETTYKNFSYSEYISTFQLVGIRDYNFGYTWVPCASCMHPTFDKKRDIIHEHVVFEHKNFRIPIRNIPKMENEGVGFEDIIDFLGSAETVITSSYHGAYWSILLGRRVIVFPFAGKFFTFKYPVSIYPARWAGRKWSGIRSMFGAVNKNEKICVNYGDWRKVKPYTPLHREALEECRARNRLF